MKITYFTSNYESVQTHLAAEFKKQGYDFKLVCYQLGGRKWKQYFPENEIVLHSSIKTKGPFLYLMKLNSYAKQAKRFIHEDPPEILYGNMMFCDGYICRRVYSEYKIPYIITVRNSDMNNAFLWKIPWFRMMGVNNLKHAQKIIFLSESYRKLLLSRLPQSLKDMVEKKSVIIPNGIDDYYLKNSYVKQPRPLSKNIRIIYVGKISKLKNIETTIAASRLLMDKGYTVNFKVIGDIIDEEYRAVLKDNEDIIEYPGKCSKEQIVEYLRDSDIFVMPSHTESFGLVYAEAMSQGVPIIYTRGQGFDGQFPDGTVGYSVSDREPGEIAEKVEMIMKDYWTISRRCSQEAHRFSWKNTVYALLNCTGRHEMI